ncbi:MAG: hypothetical protein GF398_08970 [Chitinivibrionales bacterium]|nr:hypothetical protein [Chitinivibrionales bacterium]
MIDKLFEHANPLFTLSVLLTVGFILGWLTKHIKLPAIIGQIAAGIIAGPHGIGLFDEEALHHFGPITDFALCIFGLTLGTHLIVRQYHNAFKRVLTILASEVIIIPTLIFAVLYWGLPLVNVQVSLPKALLLAAIGLTTSPSSIIHLIVHARAKGIFTKTLVSAVALNNIAAVALFSLMLPICLSVIDGGQNPGLWDFVFAPLRVLLAEVLLGGSIAAALLLLTRRQSSLTVHFSYLIIGLMLVAGISVSFRLPGFLGSMVLGFIISNYSAKKHLLLKSFSNIETPIYALFFILAGTHIDFGMAITAGAVGVAYLLSRIAGKYIAPTIGAHLAGVPATIKHNIGFALFPQAGIAIGFTLVLDSYNEFQAFSDYITTIILGSVVIYETIGPVITNLAIHKSGESNKAKTRLLDFLHEEYILVGLQQTNKWKALEELARFMHRVHGIRETSMQDLIKHIRAREKEMSTGVGDGLAVPHTIIEGGPKIRGVIGISHKGIDFDSIDGEPVYLIVLIATPKAHLDQHLHVLASIAKIFAHDPETRRQVFHAKTPAEVHEILQSGRAEEMNIYLEQELEE